MSPLCKKLQMEFSLYQAPENPTTRHKNPTTRHKPIRKQASLVSLLMEVLVNTDTPFLKCVSLSTETVLWN